MNLLKKICNFFFSRPWITSAPKCRESYDYINDTVSYKNKNKKKSRADVKEKSCRLKINITRPLLFTIRTILNDLFCCFFLDITAINMPTKMQYRPTIVLFCRPAVKIENWRWHGPPI